jgi:hypothetical protein
MITCRELRYAATTALDSKEKPRQIGTILTGQMEMHIQTHAPVFCGSITHGLTLFLLSRINYDPSSARE